MTDLGGPKHVLEDQHVAPRVRPTLHVVRDMPLPLPLPLRDRRAQARVAIALSLIAAAVLLLSALGWLYA